MKLLCQFDYNFLRLVCQKVAENDEGLKKRKKKVFKPKPSCFLRLHCFSIDDEILTFLKSLNLTSLASCAVIVSDV